MIEMIEPVDLQDRAEIHGTTVLVEYNKTEAGLAALREDLKGKTYDLATTKGNEAARADRLRCVTLRTTLEKTRKAFKAPALAYGKKIDAEAERITAEIEALEKPIDAQIRADEARREAEKEAKRQAEAARVQAHEANIARIHAFLPACNGKDSTRITRGMELLGEFEPDGTWEEFEDRGKQAKAETLAAMKVIYDRTKAAEDAAAALEAQRLEQERVAAELAKQQDEINRQRAELERQQRAIIEAAEAERAEQARRSQEAIDAAKSMAATITNTSEEAPIGTGETPAPAERAPPPHAETAQPAESLPGLLREWEKLRDPVTLHVSLLRGFPAKLDRDTFLHLAGDPPAAQPAGEPDCWAILTPNGSKLVSPQEAKGRKDAYPLYTSPPQVQRAGLTDEQIDRHSIAAADCPPSSTVILVSSLRRLLSITATKGER
mgnify:FL=1